MGDISNKDWVLNVDIISHVVPSQDGWEQGGVVWLKLPAGANKTSIHLAEKDACDLIAKLIG